MASSSSSSTAAAPDGAGVGDLEEGRQPAAALGGEHGSASGLRLRVWIRGVSDLPLQPRRCQPRLCCCSRPATVRRNVKVQCSEIDPRTAGGDSVIGHLPATYIFPAGQQDENGHVDFPDHARMWFDVRLDRPSDRQWALRFEVRYEQHGWFSMHHAFAQMPVVELARKATWRLLLCEPEGHQAVYCSPGPVQAPPDGGEPRPPAVRRPAFLHVEVQEWSGAPPPELARPSRPIGQWPRRPQDADRRRVMIFTRGTRGDVQPFVALARGLIMHHGCEVTVVTEQCWKAFIRASRRGLEDGSKLKFRPCGGNTMLRMSRPWAQWAMAAAVPNSDALQAFILSSSEAEFFPSEGCFYHWAYVENPTFIVFGFTIMHIAMIVSEALGIPIVGFILQPKRDIEARPRAGWVLDEVLDPLRRVMGSEEFNAVLKQVMERSMPCSGLNELRISRGLAPCPRNLDMSGPQFTELARQRVPLVVPIPASVLDEETQRWARGEQEVDQCCGRTDVVPVRRLTSFIFLRTEGDALPADVQGFIARARGEGRDIIAMSFSSMPVPKQAALVLAVDACMMRAGEMEANAARLACRRPAVIALIQEVGGREGALDLLRGDTVRQQQLRQSMDEHRLFISDGLPFSALFPKIDAAILHGGAGVTSEAMMAGIPVITTGILLMDQRFWAKRLHELGMGPEAAPIGVLGRRGERRHRVEELVFQVLHRNSRGTSDGRTCREEAKRVHEMIQQDGDGVALNAQVVYDFGLGRGLGEGDRERPPVVRDAYRSEMPCLSAMFRQCWCCVVALAKCLFFILCFQVPNCPRCILSVCWGVLCCRCQCCCRRGKCCIRRQESRDGETFLPAASFQ